MSDLVVLAFDSEDGAAKMSGRIESMQKMNLIALDDAATVVRPLSGKPKISQMHSLVGAGAFGGAFWGMLIGLLFFMPWMGLAIGAITGALAGKLSDVGIDDEFIKSVSSAIQPGTSALFLMIRDVTPDRVLEELQGTAGVKVLRTSLSRDAEAKLREAFATAERQEVAAS